MGGRPAVQATGHRRRGRSRRGTGRGRDVDPRDPGRARARSLCKTATGCRTATPVVAVRAVHSARVRADAGRFRVSCGASPWEAHPCTAQRDSTSRAGGQSLSMTVAHEHLIPHARALPCPMLDVAPGAADEGPVRGEIFSLDRLEEHAVDVARAHGSPRSRCAPPAALELPRNQEGHRGAYEALRGRRRSGTTRRPRRSGSSTTRTSSTTSSARSRRTCRGAIWSSSLASPSGALPATRASTRWRSTSSATPTAGSISRPSSATSPRYQSLAPLTIGELWAVPIMLRLGLAQSVRKLAEQELATRRGPRARRRLGRAHAEATARGAPPTSSSPSRSSRRATRRSTPAFVVQLLRRLREHDAMVASAFHWITERCAEMGTAARGDHRARAPAAGRTRSRSATRSPACA